MSTENHVSTPPDPEETFNDLLTYAELLTTPQLARLYIYILQQGPVTIDKIKDELEMAHSTTYKYIGQLEEMKIVSRDEEETPTTVIATPLKLEIDSAHGEFLATPAVIDAIGRQLENEDIRVFVDRQGVAKLAAAVHYTRRIIEGELSQRTAANKLNVHPVEGMTVFAALQDVLKDATAYDPYLDLAE